MNGESLEELPLNRFVYDISQEYVDRPGPEESYHRSAWGFSR